MDIYEQIKNCANANNQEVCGLIYLVNGEERFIECKNISKNKSNYFKIDPLDYARISNLGRIKAVIHSHVNDNPCFSSFDYTQCKALNHDFILFDVKSQTFKTLTQNDLILKFIGRSFNEGQDCFDFVREFYKAKFNINIPNYFPTRFRDYFRAAEKVLNCDYFVKLASHNQFKLIRNFQNFDLLCFNISKHFHLGVYIEKDLILHQPRKEISGVTELKNWNKYLICGFRYGTN